MNSEKYPCPQLSRYINEEDKPVIPDFTAGTSPQTVEQLFRDTQPSVEKSRQDIDKGFTPVEQLTDIFGSQTTRYANGTEFTWFQEIRSR